MIGGDTTRGPLNLCVQIIGEVPPGQALTRNGAKLADEVWVSGELGGAALALAHLQGRAQLGAEALGECRARLEAPEPRVALGLALRGVATSCIDLSDGLLQDLGHIVTASRVGAVLRLEDIPGAAALAHQSAAGQRDDCVLAGGDDYELCFTAPPAAAPRIVAIGDELGIRLSRVGTVSATQGISVMDAQGRPLNVTRRGFDHFA